MTDYTKLANAAVRTGVGEKAHSMETYRLPKSNCWYQPEHFIKDGRTVLALMEKCHNVGWDTCPDAQENIIEMIGPSDENFPSLMVKIDDSFAVAIAEACLRALGEISDRP